MASIDPSTPVIARRIRAGSVTDSTLGRALPTEQQSVLDKIQGLFTRSSNLKISNRELIPQLVMIDTALRPLSAKIQKTLTLDEVAIISEQVGDIERKINALDPAFSKTYDCVKGACEINEFGTGKFKSEEACKASGCEAPLSASESVAKGIINTGMNCFFNAVLQMYFRVPGLRDAVLASKIASPQANALKSIFQKLSDSTPSPIDIHDDYKALFTGKEDTFLKTDGSAKTGDAAEFITSVLENVLGGMNDTKPLDLVKVIDETSTTCTNKPSEVSKTSVDASLVPLNVPLNTLPPLDSLNKILNQTTTATDTSGEGCGVPGLERTISHKYTPNPKTSHLVVYLKRTGDTFKPGGVGDFKSTAIAVNPVITSGTATYQLVSSVLYSPGGVGHYLAAVHDNTGKVKTVLNDQTVSSVLPIGIRVDTNGVIFLYKLVGYGDGGSGSGGSSSSNNKPGLDVGPSGSGRRAKPVTPGPNDSEISPSYVLTPDQFKTFMLETVITKNSSSTGYVDVEGAKEPWNDKYYFKFPVILVNKEPATNEVDDLRRFSDETGLKEVDILAVNGRFVKNSIKDAARSITYDSITNHLLIFASGLTSINQVLPIQKDFIEFFHQILFQAALNKRSVPAFASPFIEKYKGFLALLDDFNLKGDIFGLPGFELLKWWNIDRMPLYATFEVIPLDKLVEFMKKPKSLLSLFKAEVGFVEKVPFRVEDLEAEFDETANNYETTIAAINKRNAALREEGLRLLGASETLVSPTTFFDDLLAGIADGNVSDDSVTDDTVSDSSVTDGPVVVPVSGPKVLLNPEAQKEAMSLAIEQLMLINEKEYEDAETSRTIIDQVTRSIQAYHNRTGTTEPSPEYLKKGSFEIVGSAKKILRDIYKSIIAEVKPILQKRGGMFKRAPTVEEKNREATELAVRQLTEKLSKFSTFSIPNEAAIQSATGHIVENANAELGPVAAAFALPDEAKAIAIESALRVLRKTASNLGPNSNAVRETVKQEILAVLRTYYRRNSLTLPTVDELESSVADVVKTARERIDSEPNEPVHAEAFKAAKDAAAIVFKAAAEGKTLGAAAKSPEDYAMDEALKALNTYYVGKAKPTDAVIFAAADAAVREAKALTPTDSPISASTRDKAKTAALEELINRRRNGMRPESVIVRRKAKAVAIAMLNRTLGPMKSAGLVDQIDAAAEAAVEAAYLELERIPVDRSNENSIQVAAGIVFNYFKTIGPLPTPEQLVEAKQMATNRLNEYWSRAPLSPNELETGSAEAVTRARRTLQEIVNEAKAAATGFLRDSKREEAERAANEAIRDELPDDAIRKLFVDEAIATSETKVGGGRKKRHSTFSQHHTSSESNGMFQKTRKAHRI